MEAQDCKMKNLIAELFDFKLDLFRGGRKGGTNIAIPHVVAQEYHNTASRFTQIPKPQVQIRNS